MENHPDRSSRSHYVVASAVSGSGGQQQQQPHEVVMPRHPYSPDDRPSPAKRARVVIPVLAGAIAGSIITFAGLAFV